MGKTGSSLGTGGGAIGTGRRNGVRGRHPSYVAHRCKSGGDNHLLGLAVDRVGPILGDIGVQAVHIGQRGQHRATHMDIARGELAAGDFHVDKAHSIALRVVLPVATIVTTRRSIGDGSSTTIAPSFTRRRMR